MMTKNVNERREALQYYLLGCKVPADEGDPAVKKRKVTREKYTADKATAKPESPYINGQQFHVLLPWEIYLCYNIKLKEADSEWW
jgi:hypothetical protein